MDYSQEDSQVQQPIWSYSWLAQAMGGQQQIDLLNIAQSTAPEVYRPAILGPMMYHDEMYYCPGATGDLSIHLNQPNGVDRQDISQPVQYPFVVVQNTSPLVANNQTPFQYQLSYPLHEQQDVEPIVDVPPATISPSLTISGNTASQSPIARPSLIRRDLSMTPLTPTPTCTPSSEQTPPSDSESVRRTYELLAETDAFLRNSCNHDQLVEDQYPYPMESILPVMPPLEHPIPDARRLSVDSDSTYTSHFSESSNSSMTVAGQDDMTLVDSPRLGNLTAVCLPGSVDDSPGDSTYDSSDVPVQAPELDTPPAPSIFRRHSPPPCMLDRSLTTPGSASPTMPAALHVVATPPRAEQFSLAVVEGMVSPIMHSADPVPPPSEIAEIEDLPAKDKHESEAVTKTLPPASPLVVKKEKLDNEEIDQIVRDWTLAPDPAGVAKTRRRKQTSALAIMSSHRMPSHFKKRPRAPRKTSSHTPSKTPSPPPSEFVDTRSPSPFIPILPPSVVEPTLPSLPPPAIDKKPLLPPRAKPVHPRRSRLTKPAAVPRASPAHHPATGRPSKACLFCRRRKIGCTQSETIKDSCQQCIDRHLTCEYPPDVQLAALAHASSSSSSLVSRRTRRELKRESM